IELAQPGEQDCQRPVVVRVPWCPAARTAAAAFHDQSEMAAISFDKKLGIHDTAMVINQTHESQTPTQRRVVSLTTLRAPGPTLRMGAFLEDLPTCCFVSSR